MFLGKVLVFGLALLCALAVSAGQLGLFAGTAPTDLGVRDGRLKPPSLTENSVSSQSGLYPDHPQRDYAAIAPLPLKGDGPATLAAIKVIVEGMAGAVVAKSEPDYLYAQYTSKWMQFVDDVEFWFDPVAGAVQVRSASRVGRSDLGVNRRRIEEVRAALAARP
jgi:uncharacterized protein (DUF1499 family)